MCRKRYVVRWLGRKGPRRLPYGVIDTKDGQVMRSDLGLLEAGNLAEKLNRKMGKPWWKRLLKRQPPQSLEADGGEAEGVLSETVTYQKHTCQGLLGGIVRLLKGGNHRGPTTPPCAAAAAARRTRKPGGK